MERMKLGVALAVLKSKPANIGGEEYAAQLAARFKASQLHWKERYEKAEAEILHLKQQLVLSAHAVKCTGESAVTLNDDQLIFPTPPPSGSVDISQSANRTAAAVDGNVSLAKHTEFLHHVINIQTVCTTLMSDTSLQTVTEQSVLHSLDLLKEHLGKAEITWNMQEKCVACIITIIEKSNSSQFVCTVLDKFFDLCSTVVEKIMSQTRYCYMTLEKQCRLLLTFGSCDQFIPRLLDILSNSVLEYSDDLRNCVQNKTAIDPKRFCNIYYIFKACEQVLTAKLCCLSEDSKTSTLQRLEDSLLHISERFPLFAHAVWRLCAFLS